MTRRPTRRGAAVALAAATALGASVLTAPAAGAAPADGGDPDGINGFRSVGYFQAHAPSKEDGGRDYQVEDIITSGAIDDLTHLNYSFGNVTTDLVCDISDGVVPDHGVDPGEVEGDPENDYLRLVSAKDSVDGVADSPDQALAGNFNQLRKLKEEYPGIKILVSLGGWTWSDNFPAATATPEAREKLVESCLDLYIDGDLPVYGDQGGEGVAAGIFDGIDIDWEWPAANGEHGPVYGDEEKANFLAMLQEFRTELDERAEANDTEYLLTGFAPAGWAPRTNGGWVDPIAIDSFDYINIQGYDYHGGWVGNRTGHQGNLHAYDWPVDPTQPDGEQTSANWGLAADGLLNAYKAAGYDGEQLNLGMAVYGQGWEGVTDGEIAGTAATASIGTPTYDELKNLGKAYFDPEAGASWRYDGDRWYSYDDKKSVNAKSEWLAENDFGGAMWWDISGDKKNDLVGQAADTFRTATPGPQVGEQCAAPWYAAGVYTKGATVSHDGVEYEAKYWTRNQEPGSSSAWTEIGGCGTAPAVEVEQCGDAWDSAATYRKGDVVTRAGVNYTAQWWTKGDLPGGSAWSSWDAGVPCA
ncbi:chitinase [Paraoerskovia marina]|uniref:chitinase n=1 Tax=Paraoerskovia marina TaxID=545619 RepID=A0A1H1PJ41_9CELL|nr:glycosyl hydrolase family 18 protein [Paraoerskovia marina]SDS11154.1 chitinase [Paraoerskovia marina]